MDTTSGSEPVPSSEVMLLSPSMEDTQMEGRKRGIHTDVGFIRIRERTGGRTTSGDGSCDHPP